MVGPASQSAQRDAQDPPAEPFSRGVRILGGRAHSRPRRIATIVAGVVLALVALVAIITLIQQHSYAGRVLPGVKVDGVSAAGRREVAVNDDVARLGVTLARSPVRVRIGNQELSAGPSLLDLSVDARATARAAMRAGRRGTFLGRMLGTAARWVRPERVHLRVVYDEDRLEGILDGWAAETDKGKVEGDLRFVGTRVVAIEPHAGTGIVRARARAALVRMLAGPQRPELTLPVGTLRPRVSANAVNAAARRARRLLAHNTVIAIGSTHVTLTPQQLARALGTQIAGHDLRVTLDAARLHAALGSKLASLESPPVDATFEITAQNAVHIVPSRVGREIDISAVARAILLGRQRIAAPLRNVSPRRDTKWATDLGIVREVSSFTTEYPPGQTRVLNIHRGADLLNNTVVEPGQDFSLNQTIGPRTKARGFVTAPVFAQGEFFDDYGGGVSQLATTTYNAAFFGGYQDITHQPHTIYISRYPAGREATVNYGVIDLQFRDNTAHGVLIRAYYSDTSITVTLYGDTGGRTVREENRTISNPVFVTDEPFACPAPKLVDPHDLCATLPAGQTEQISTGDAGFDVAFDRVIDEPGARERREHYTWHYTMLPNQILVGTDPNLPTTVTTATTAASSTPTTVLEPAAGTTPGPTVRTLPTTPVTTPTTVPTTAPTSTNAPP